MTMICEVFDVAGTKSSTGICSGDKLKIVVDTTASEGDAGTRNVYHFCGTDLQDNRIEIPSKDVDFTIVYRFESDDNTRKPGFDCTLESFDASDNEPPAPPPPPPSPSPPPPSSTIDFANDPCPCGIKGWLQIRIKLKLHLIT